MPDETIAVVYTMAKQGSWGKERRLPWGAPSYRDPRSDDGALAARVIGRAPGGLHGIFGEARDRSAVAWPFL